MSNLYLYINLFVLLGPLALSFDTRVAFYKKWKFLFPAIIVALVPFIIWDIVFTMNGVWGFNPEYLSGISIFHLPLGEWLFFITVPYACVFIYECVKVYFKVTLPKSIVKGITLGIIAILLILAIVYHNSIYTFITFLSTSIFLIMMLVFKKTDLLGKLYIAYPLILIPFFIVNGVLTGSGIEEQIVWYNNDENMGIRIFTIPVEDIIYNLLLLLLAITVYEYLIEKAKIENEISA